MQENLESFSWRHGWGGIERWYWERSLIKRDTY